jgi:hypothetical protein
MPSTLHSIALHHRADAARVSAALAAEKLKNALLDFVATAECHASLTLAVVQAIKSLPGFVPGSSSSGLNMLVMDKLGGVLPARIQALYNDLLQAKDDAMVLTRAAQELELCHDVPL